MTTSNAASVTSSFLMPITNNQSPALPRTGMAPPADDRLIDQREQLFNGGETGPIRAVQLPVDRITAVRGILFDLDPKLIRRGSLIPHLASDPRQFYERVVRHWLERHAVLAKAEVRLSGTGLHVILRFDPAIELESPDDRQYWAAVVEVVQASLPIDPHQPGLTALTRPLGSVNAKNGAVVELLAPGSPVSKDEVLSLFKEIDVAPFLTIFKILAGTPTIAPCPFCRTDGSRFDALNQVGKCYGCGSVKLARLFDSVLLPAVPSSPEVE